MTSIVSCEAPGHYGFTDLFKPGSTSEACKLPVGGIEIGGGGFLLPEQPTETNLITLSDGTFSSWELGADLLVYACYELSTPGIAKILISKNTTAPAGYTVLNSRIIGGFHVGRVRPLAEKFNKSFTCPIQPVPNSFWDLERRPTCDPRGMIEIVPGARWVDIYLASIKSGTGLEAVIQSKYNQVPVTGTEGYNYIDLHNLAKKNGKEAVDYWDFTHAAHGTPNGNSKQSGRLNTGIFTGYGFDCVSTQNMDQGSGNIYQVGRELYDRGIGADAYQNTLNTGIDAANNVGQWYGMQMRMTLYGGVWNPTQSGSRVVHLNSSPWDVNGDVGLRAACDSKASRVSGFSDLKI